MLSETTCTRFLPDKAKPLLDREKHTLKICYDIHAKDLNPLQNDESAMVSTYLNGIWSKGTVVEHCGFR